MKLLKIILSLIVFATTSYSYAGNFEIESLRCGEKAYCSPQQVIEDFNFLKSKKVNKKIMSSYVNKAGEGLVVLGTSAFLISIAHQMITAGSTWDYFTIRIYSVFAASAGGLIMLATHSSELADGTMTSYLATDEGISTLMTLESGDMLKSARMNYLIAEKIVSLASLIRIYDSEKK